MNPDNVSPLSPATERLCARLREELLALPYAAFLLVIARLLERQGYRGVSLLGRKGFVGRNRSGGWDVEAIAPGQQLAASGQQGLRCIIQVKQFDELAVQQRSVDELRGCVLRAGAGLGLLITTSRFSPVARQAAQASSLAPVVLLDGDGLLSLLLSQRLGVRQKPNGKWEIDPEFFRTVRSQAARKAQEEKAQEEKAKKVTKRKQNRLLSSPAIADSWPDNRQCSPCVPPQKRRVLHLSIVLGDDDTTKKAV